MCGARIHPEQQHRPRHRHRSCRRRHRRRPRMARSPRGWCRSACRRARPTAMAMAIALLVLVLETAALLMELAVRRTSSRILATSLRFLAPRDATKREMSSLRNASARNTSLRTALYQPKVRRTSSCHWLEERWLATLLNLHCHVHCVSLCVSNASCCCGFFRIPMCGCVLLARQCWAMAFPSVEKCRIFQLLRGTYVERKCATTCSNKQYAY